LPIFDIASLHNLQTHRACRPGDGLDGGIEAIGADPSSSAGDLAHLRHGYRPGGAETSSSRR
jgi:hypothetical protein